MARKLLLKRAVSSFTALAIATVAMPVIPAFAEVGTVSYSFDGYDVEYSVKNEWIDGQSIEVKITNTGDEPILNWAFKYDAEGEINGLWNASVYDSQETSYIIKNVGWNYEIAPDASVSFGYTLSDYSGTNPDKFELCAKRVDKTDGYDVQYNITNEWDTGLQGEIVITNTSEEPLEAWELSFDSTFAINNLWNGKIISSEDNHYVVASEMWSNPIAVGASVTIGFTGDKVEETELAINNTKVSVVEIEKLETKPVEVDLEDDTDTDGDGLPDVYEIYLFGTGPENIDSDDDGLTDYEEAVLTGTDPTKYDSVTEGIPDAEADTDRDGLSNKIELELGTDPLNKDTDGDTLSDGDEINTYGTDPLNVDTDSDKLNDNYEFKNSTDPLNPDTDGNGILDGDESYTVSIDKNNIERTLFEDNVAIPSLEITGKGDANAYVKVEEYTGNEQVDEFCVGKTIVISGDDIESGTLSFKVSDDNAFSNYEYAEGYTASSVVICFNNGSITTPLITSIDKELGTITAAIKEKGTYFIADLAKLLINFDFDKHMLDTGDYELGGQADIVFIVDVTGSMSGTINKVINNISAFAEEVESSGVRPRYALVEYGDITCDGRGSTKVKTNGNSNWYTDTETFKKALQNLGRTGGGDTPECAIDALAMAYNLDMRESAEKCFVLVTDADYKIANNFGYTSDTQLFNEIANKDINVAVATGTGYYSVYKKLVDTTKGFCCNIYGNFQKELLKISDFISEKTNDGYWIALNGYLPYVVKLKAEPVAGSLIDTDYDRVPDVEEIGEKTTFSMTPFALAALESAGYSLDDVDWVYPDVEVYTYTSIPVNEDSDNDGILDCDDNRDLIKGFYSEEVNDIVIGELAIVSHCSDTEIDMGHSFFCYQSYVNDKIDFSGIYGGFGSTNNVPMVAGKYNINKDEYISIGNTANDTGSSPENFSKESVLTIGYKPKSLNANAGTPNNTNSSAVSSEAIGGTIGGSSIGSSTGSSSGIVIDAALGLGLSRLEGGIFFNRELHNIYTGYATYGENVAIKRQITQKQWDELIKFCSNNNYYVFLNHNCSTVARKGWNKIFDDNLTSEFVFGIDTPAALKNCLKGRGGVENYLSDIIA